MRASVMKTPRCATTRTRSLVLAVCCLLVGSHAKGQDRPLLSEQMVGREFSYTAQPGDSLTAIGARFGVSSSVLASRNSLAPNARLKITQQLVVDNRHIVPQAIDDGIVINLPQRMLFFFKNGQTSGAYPVGLGKQDWPTPSGRFQIAVKEENPVWDVPKSIQEEMRREGKVVQTCVPPGPENPLGKHWLGLSIGGYGIHGTIAPSSIYQFQTHGCIRLHPDDVAQLFAAVERGTPVLLLYSRLLLARIGARIFLEVHRDIYGKQAGIEKELRQLIESENLAARVDWRLADDIIRRQQGIAREITKENSPNIDHEAAGPHSRPPLPKQ
ncbi:MAG: L,D-transpeptidase family protein [Candidatus Binatia bacterium]